MKVYLDEVSRGWTHLGVTPGGDKYHLSDLSHPLTIGCKKKSNLGTYLIKIAGPLSY